MVQTDKICCLVDPQSSSNSYFFKVIVPASIMQNFFDLAIQHQQNIVNPTGFKQGITPRLYIQEHFKTPILKSIKDLGLRFFGINALLQHIRAEKIVLIGHPELKDIEVDSQGNAIYTFQASTPKELYIQSWKYLPFQAVPRKKYRDIDKQVALFLQEETELSAKNATNQKIYPLDWVNFKIWVLDKNNEPLFADKMTSNWIRIGDEETDIDTQKLFVGKKVGDKFVTDNIIFQEYFCQNSYNQYDYLVEILDVVPYNNFSFDNFKHYFKIKTHKDLLSKITEIFSFNNDISQRRSIAFEALDLIIRKNQIVIPDASIFSQKKQIIQTLQYKTDFIVYKQDPDFEHHITNMAQRQLLDSAVAENIAYQDNLQISQTDIKAILQLTQRPRLRDFLYFPFIKTQMQGQEIPIDAATLYHYALKEKAVNHIIYHLTKK